MLPGLKSMLNIHPLFVHFPIAFWFGALLFESLAIWRSNDDQHRTAVRLLYLGTLSAFVTAFTGWLAQSSVEPSLAIQRVFDIHETLMLIATSLATALSIYCFAKRANFTAAARRILLSGTHRARNRHHYRHRPRRAARLPIRAIRKRPRRIEVVRIGCRGAACCALIRKCLVTGHEFTRAVSQSNLRGFNPCAL